MTNVTRPFLPPLEEFLPLLEDIWHSGTLSNNGPYHKRFEESLSSYMGCDHLSLVCNATVGLMVAQKALGLRGEIITTPYSFVATANAICWMGNTPVFVDVEPESLCLDPALIEAAITENTVGIMPLHCYGNTCNVAAIAEVATRHNLKVIYDACHSFGVRDKGGSIFRHGDASVVSFHATKVFNTFEGGMVVVGDSAIKQAIDLLKNFGFSDETTVLESGINGKMSEFNAALGLVQLRYFEESLKNREKLDALYRDHLEEVPGVRFLEPVRQHKRNYAYFPIFVGPEYPLTRDNLAVLLQSRGVYTRRYFFPLIPEYSSYQESYAAAREHTPVALQASREVICLPLFADLEEHTVIEICQTVAEAVS